MVEEGEERPLDADEIEIVALDELDTLDLYCVLLLGSIHLAAVLAMDGLE
jgi:hypothetical protein